MDTSKPDRLFTVAELSRRFGISARHLRRAIRSGDLSAFRTGSRWARLRLADVDRWLARHRVVESPDDADYQQLRDALCRVRALLGQFLEHDGGMEGRVRARHAVLSDALDVIRDSLDRSSHTGREGAPR